MDSTLSATLSAAAPKRLVLTGIDLAVYQVAYFAAGGTCGRPHTWEGREPLNRLISGGRYWDRTSDLFRVREARYRCANRPSPLGFRGGDGIRTRVDGFAGRCLTSRPLHQRVPAC